MADRYNVLIIKMDDTSPDTFDKMTHLSSRTDLVIFPNYYFDLSVCAASRITMYTGLNAAHHGVTGNSLAGDWDISPGAAVMLPKWLKTTGYKTALFGKYLNGYPWAKGDAYIPTGWDEWRVMLNDSAVHPTHRMGYFNYFLNINGTTGSFTTNDPWTGVGYDTTAASNRTASTDYETDNVNRRTQTYLSTATEPFYVELGLWACHGDPDSTPAADTPIPAARHASIPYTYTPTADWNEAVISDKPKWLQDTVPNTMDSTEQSFANSYRKQQWRASLAVDELIYDVFQKLSSQGLLERTVVIICADNGAMIGEHRLTFQTAGSVKNMPYEPSVHSRLYIRYPGVAGRIDNSLVSNIDICPTICDISKAIPTTRPDGMSLVPLLTGQTTNWRRDLLFQYSPIDNSSVAELPKYGAVITTNNYKLIRYDAKDADPAEDELYDLNADPLELVNQAANPAFATIKADLASRVATLLIG